MSDDTIPDGDLDTPHGRLYRPLSEGLQAVVLLIVFLAGPALGWLVGQIPGDLSENAQIALYIPYVLILFLGYGAWIARLKTIAFEGIGRSILGVLFQLVIRRKKPESMEDVLPSKEKLLRMAVSAQKAGASFGPVSWPIALISGLVATLFDSNMSGMTLFTLVAFSCLFWGYLLAWLGRRGRLPILDEG